jgi:hypothetical protein
VPARQSYDSPDFAISPFEDTGEQRAIAGPGRVVDDVDWFEREMAGWPGDGRPDPRGAPRQRVPDRATGQQPAVGSDLVRYQPPPAGPPPFVAPPSPVIADAPFDPEFDEPDGSFEPAPRISAAVATVAALTWYALAATLYLLGLIVVKSGSQAADCTGEAVCESPRAQALTQALDVLPYLGIASVQAVVFALILRWLGPGWRAAGLGFSAATVAAATTTALYTVLGSAI